MKSIKILAAIFILLAFPALAQSDQEIYSGIQQEMGRVQMNAQQTQQMYQLAQMGGTQADFQRLQAEFQLHEQVYGYLQGLLQNPGVVRTPQGFNQYKAVLLEYDYRIRAGDYSSPSEQIQAQVQAYTQQQVWQATTPEGQASFQNGLAAQQRQFDANQAQHRANVAQFDNQQAQYRANQAQSDFNQERYVNSGIWERSEYVNVNDGQTYMIPHSYEQPYMQHTDGYYYQMQPGRY
jgi:hypothetical protein